LNKWGDDAIVDLAAATWQGARFEWVRRQENYARRAGLSCAEAKRADMLDAAWQELAAELTQINQAYLASRPQKSAPQPFEGWFMAE
ncbi:hypothetical protein, partial [Enterococcus faecium]|uniref:hypothetical protein n=1 Tax=Enterococcus faecium TaxID=1352 RepID=UPI003F444553